MLEKFHLDGKTALVTGGSRGIGFGISLALAQAGSNIVLVARDADLLEKARSRIAPTRRAVSVFEFDLTRVDEIPDFYSRVAAQIGGIDILVNNAGGTVRGATETIKRSDLNFIMDLNLTSVFVLCQEFARERIRSGQAGKIINIASIMSETVRPGAAAYAMTKGGIRQLTKGLAVEWAQHHIHVNAIGPGFTRTDLTSVLWKDKAFEAAVNLRTPLGRWGTPEDIGAAAVFLASSASDFITGQILYVDGGLTSSMGVFQ
jgi:gluconate 5-dehydrogenase